jgi:hypothetical protein
MGSQYSPRQIETMSVEEALKARLALINELFSSEADLAGTQYNDPNYQMKNEEVQLRVKMIAQVREKLLLHATEALQSSAADLVIHSRKLNRLTYILVVLTLVLTIFTVFLVSGIRFP